MWGKLEEQPAFRVWIGCAAISEVIFKLYRCIAWAIVIFHMLRQDGAYDKSKEEANQRIWDENIHMLISHPIPKSGEVLNTLERLLK